MKRKLSERVSKFVSQELEARLGRPPTQDEFDRFIIGPQHIRDEIIKNGVK